MKPMQALRTLDWMYDRMLKVRERYQPRTPGYDTLSMQLGAVDHARKLAPTTQMRSRGKSRQPSERLPRPCASTTPVWRRNGFTSSLAPAPATTNTGAVTSAGRPFAPSSA